MEGLLFSLCSVCLSVRNSLWATNRRLTKEQSELDDCPVPDRLVLDNLMTIHNRLLIPYHEERKKLKVLHPVTERRRLVIASEANERQWTVLADNVTNCLTLFQFFRDRSKSWIGRNLPPSLHYWKSTDWLVSRWQTSSGMMNLVFRGAWKISL